MSRWRRVGLGLVAWLSGTVAMAQAPADDCAEAPVIDLGTFAGVISGATPDGQSCQANRPDVWVAVEPATSARLFVKVAAATYDPTVSVHRGCPGTSSNQVACAFTGQDQVSFRPTAGDRYFVRVAGGPGPFTLEVDTGGAIRGTVLDQATGMPIPGVQMQASGGSDTTDVAGRFTIDELPAGETRVWVDDDRPYIPEMYDDVPCPFGDQQTCFDQATLVPVALATVTEGIDFVLDLGGVIEGTVRAADTGEPLRADVGLFDAAGAFLFRRPTSSDGTYRIDGLVAGLYYLRARPTEEAYQTEVYEDLPCVIPCDVTAGQAVSVMLGETAAAVDFALDPFGGITGRVTDEETGQPIEDYPVVIRDHDGNIETRVETGPDGRYVATLSPGTYFVVSEASFSSGRLWVDEVYDDRRCDDRFEPCEVTLSGTPVVVALETLTEGIDFALSRGGRVTGVLRDASGAPIGGERVTLYRADGSVALTATSDFTGRYTVGPVAGGTYFATAGEASYGTAARYQVVLHDGLPCGPQSTATCDVRNGTPLAVVYGEAGADVDFVLRRLGRIRGTVFDEASGQPLVGLSDEASITAYRADGTVAARAMTMYDGTYVIEGLPTEPVFLVLVHDRYFDELYDDLPCEGGCDPGTGTPLVVALDEEREAIHFRLADGAELTGEVVDAETGFRISGSVHYLVDAGGAVVATGGGADLRFTGLDPGTYRLGVEHEGRDYFAALYDGVDCGVDFASCDLSRATPITVTANASVDDLTIALRPRVDRIRGTVVDAETGQPLPHFHRVRIYDGDGNQREQVEVRTDTGRFESRVLGPGTYFLVTDRAAPWIDERYHDQLCINGTCDPTAGTPITLTLTRGADVTIALTRGVAISGTVIDATTGAAPTGGFLGVTARDTDGTAVGFDALAADGSWRIEGLPPGTYFVETRAAGYIDQIWPGVPCTFSCDLDDGMPVVVGPNGVEGLDFALLPETDAACQPTTESLCLLENRFRVEVDWRNQLDDEGAGQAVPLTSDAGYLWFFRPDNVEVVIKVLDACQTPFKSFWVFAAGLTNVEATLRVTDTWTGAVRQYTNPLGIPYLPIQDNQAFATCDALPPAHAAAPAPAGRTAEASGVDPVRTKGGCVADAETLCADGGRFALRTRWRNQLGEDGAGQAVPLTADTGYFWFFRPDNIEVVAKVLDACAMFDRFWVFAGGLTNVEVELEVTDTVSGVVRTYSNPLGTRFQPIQDNQAFATCP